ncbi:hypothetical protein OH76DRAFT_1418329 [Lentinus brumalis]|uniref:Uncharacterized protein n=1 Tax=Lentinus brumalis TaxID=2498619 RepID=A0A371DAN2_9APHY|nr:hypothetical protein OH76DRAFT_1418329 [Polyporus brumalis]
MQTRKPKSVFVNVNGSSLEHEILNVCQFNSTRKRMSTVVRCPDGKPKLFWKGADTVMQEAVRRCQTLYGFAVGANISKKTLVPWHKVAANILLPDHIRLNLGVRTAPSEVAYMGMTHLDRL